MAATKIVFLILPNIHLLDLAGADQAFLEAMDYGANLEIEYCSYDLNLKTSSGFPLGKLRDFREIVLKSGDFIFIPGADLKYVLSAEMKSQCELIQWVQNAYSKKVRICSICTGAFFLGLAGLLDHRKCTTHWKRTAELQVAFPKAKVAENILFIEDNGIYSSAGVSAGIDLALHIISQLNDEQMAYHVARELVVYLRRSGNEEQQSVFLTYRNHIHTGIHQVQDWIQDNLHQKSTLEELASLAFMSSRSLTRTFKKETGITIHEYTTLLRKERARELLKKPDLSRRKIANLCGLQSERHLGRIVSNQQ